MAESVILTGIKDHDLFIIVNGRGTAEYCSSLNQCILMLLASQSINRILFDCSNACYVDSSFIGIILSLKKKFHHVYLLNPDVRIVEIFDIMGLTSFVPIIEEAYFCDSCTHFVDKKVETTVADMRLLLEAHQHIMATSSENKQKFILVEKFFQQEIDKHSTDK